MTTGAAAKKLGRNYIMIEKNISYCQYGKKRLDSVSYENTDIANAIFDIKPKKATMIDMIKSGYFIENEWFYFKDGTKLAQLSDAGKLLYKA